MPRPGFLTSVFLAGLAVLAIATEARAADPIAIPIVYLERDLPPQPTLSNLDPVPTDLGIQGARLAIGDSNTTGAFLGQRYELTEVQVAEDGDLLAEVGEASLIVANLLHADLLTLADARPDALIFNVGAPGTVLRSGECRANVLHTLPSDAMRADALAQFLLRKRWSEWLLLVGPSEADQDFSEALRDAARKFGHDIVEDTGWDSITDLRRDANQEIPRLTNQSEHDVVVVADQIGDFARYLPYNTYYARPVAGDEGLVPTGWSREVEQWGAAQLQSRFVEQAGRAMQAEDYAAWTAIRAIAEAATRSKASVFSDAGAVDAAGFRAYLLSEKFQLAAFKGRKMSFRNWNGQLRQPIPLVHPRALVALAPIAGFLHPVTEMDTLGLDRPESKCEVFDK